MAYVAAGAVLVHIGDQACRSSAARSASRWRRFRPAKLEGPEPARGAQRHLAGRRCRHGAHRRADHHLVPARVAAGAAFRQGLQGIPVNRSAFAAGVLRSARSPEYRLTVVNGATTKAFTVAELSALPQATHRLPIACVEGWSATADWTGVLLADPIRAVGETPTPTWDDLAGTARAVLRTALPARHARDSKTLDRAEVERGTLDIDHGYHRRG